MNNLKDEIRHENTEALPKARTAIEDRYYELHPESAELYERAKLNFPKGVTHEARNMTPFPVHMTHGLGSRKWDVDGNEYVEYNTGHGSMILE